MHTKAKNSKKGGANKPSENTREKHFCLELGSKIRKKRVV